MPPASQLALGPLGFGLVRPLLILFLPHPKHLHSPGLLDPLCPIEE